VNEYTTFRILGSMGQVVNMRDSLKDNIQEVLEYCLEELDDQQGVKKNIENILASLEESRD
jgi:hypothetical protein